MREAADWAFTWFSFLIDDVWPIHGCPSSFLSELRQLLRQSAGSRIPTSTRSVKVADVAGRIPDPGTRDPPDFIINKSETISFPIVLN